MKTNIENVSRHFGEHLMCAPEKLVRACSHFIAKRTPSFHSLTHNYLVRCAVMPQSNLCI